MASTPRNDNAIELEAGKEQLRAEPTPAETAAPPGAAPAPGAAPEISWDDVADELARKREEERAAYQRAEEQLLAWRARVAPAGEPR